MYKVKDEYLAYKFSGLIGSALVQKEIGKLTQSELKAQCEADPAWKEKFTTTEAVKEAIQSDKK